MLASNVHYFSLSTVGSYVLFPHSVVQYVRRLLFSDLDKSTIENVLRQLRKLPWSECDQYLLKCFMKVHKGKYGQIHLIASLTSGLSRYHDEFSIAVVDEVISVHWKHCYLKNWDCQSTYYLQSVLYWCHFIWFYIFIHTKGWSVVFFTRVKMLSCDWKQIILVHVFLTNYNKTKGKIPF